MKTKYIYFLLMAVLSVNTYAQSLRNQGANITITAGTRMVMKDVKYINLDDGRMNLDGAIRTNANVINNSATSQLLANADNDGFLIFNGTALLGGSSSNTMVLENLRVQSGVILGVQAGTNLTINNQLENNGTLSLRSNSNGTASLIDANNNIGTGTDQSELYLGNGNRYYYLSSPVSGEVVGDVFGDVTSTTPGEKKMFRFNGVDWTQLQNTDALNAMQGYAFKPGSATSTWTFAGAYHSADYTYPLFDNAYTLVGNPYPSALDWGLEGDVIPASWNEATTNVSGNLWYRIGGDGTNAGSFATYNRYGGISLNGGGRHIPPMQAFWVESLGTNVSLSVGNDARVHNNQPFYRSVKSSSRGIYVSITNTQKADEIYIGFNANATDGYDKYDAHKMLANENPQIYTQMLPSHKLAINTLQNFNESISIPVGVNAPAKGTYSISIRNHNDFEAQYVYLEDKENGTFNDLRKANYSFETVAGENTSRFVLHFSNVATSLPDNTTDNIAIWSNNGSIYVNTAHNDAQVYVYDMVGKLITWSKNATNCQLPIQSRTAMYMVQVVTTNQTITKHVFVD